MGNRAEGWVLIMIFAGIFLTAHYDALTRDASVTLLIGLVAVNMLVMGYVILLSNADLFDEKSMFLFAGLYGVVVAPMTTGIVGLGFGTIAAFFAGLLFQLAVVLFVTGIDKLRTRIFQTRTL